MRGAQFVDPSALARIGNLELVARTVVDGFINGLHRAPHLGFSLDFAEHRGYVPGDDLRRVDWRVFARTDRYYVKQFEADTNANCVVALDVSTSMRFGSGGDLEARLRPLPRGVAAVLLAPAARPRRPDHLRRPRCVEYVPPSAQAPRVRAARARSDRRSDSRASLAAPLLTLTERLARRGIVVVISDLYDEPEAHRAGRQAAALPRPRRHRVPRARSGRDRLPVRRGGELRGPRERRPDAHRARGAARAVPRARAGAHRALGRLFTDSRIDYALFNTSVPLDHALFHYLATRERMSRVR